MPLSYDSQTGAIVLPNFPPETIDFVNFSQGGDPSMSDEKAERLLAEAPPEDDPEC